MAYINIEDRRACSSRHYRANKDVYKARARANSKRTRAAVKEFLLAYLQSHPCVDCGEREAIVLEFDHRSGSNKLFQIGDANSKNYSLRSVRSEVEKCDVRCANCHRRATYRRRGLKHRG